MARDLDEAIAEEEEYEAEDADQIKEQEYKSEYDDVEGENTAPTKSIPFKRGDRNMVKKKAAKKAVKKKAAKKTVKKKAKKK